MTDTERNHQELCLLYENAAMNLEALKRRRWQAYALYSAITAFLVHETDKISFQKPYITVALLLGAIAVEFTQALHRENMASYRDITKNIRDRFGYVFKECYKPREGRRKPDTFEKWFKYVGSIYIFTTFSMAMSFLLPEVLTWFALLLIGILAIALPDAMDKRVFINNKEDKK